MSQSWVKICVVYQDLPDLIELAVEMRHGGWSAIGSIYAPPTLVTQHAQLLVRWSYNPQGWARLESTPSRVCGGLLMEFGTVDSLLHVRCNFQLESRSLRPGLPWRVSVEIPTELGLVERFGKELRALGENLSGEAQLEGLSAP